jgi:hypothetical protein
MSLAIRLYRVAKMSGDLNFDIPEGNAVGECASVTKKGDGAEIILRPSQSGSNDTDLDSFVDLASKRTRLWYLQMLPNQQKRSKM